MPRGPFRTSSTRHQVARATTTANRRRSRDERTGVADRVLATSGRIRSVGPDLDPRKSVARRVRRVYTATIIRVAGLRNHVVAQLDSIYYYTRASITM